METNETKIVAVLHERTKNDTNGNPRRVWVGIGEGGHIVRTEDEGYAGCPQWVRDLAEVGIWDVSVEVTPREYKLRVKQGESLAKLADSFSQKV